MSQTLAFLTPSISDLRYLIPFAKVATRVFEGKIVFSLRRWGQKWNGLANEANFKRTLEIITSECQSSVIEVDEQHDFDTIVQVETCADLNSKKRILLSHGFDLAWLKSDINKQADAYVCSTALSTAFALKHGIDNVLCAPFPVALWDVHDVVPNGMRVFMFYPDSGNVELASMIIEKLVGLGFDVIVKQRRKHQPIVSGGRHVYDDVWYPSESIVCPLSSRFVVGFGSTAYIDLVDAGVYYINIDVNSECDPWNVFIHPTSDNYSHVLDACDIDQAIERAINVVPKLQTFSSESVEQFVIQLLYEKGDHKCSRLKFEIST